MTKVNTKLYYKFTELTNHNFSLNSRFSIKQKELKLKKQMKNKKHVFEIAEIEYRCTWIENSNYDSSKPTLIIPTKNMSRLIKKTILNLEENEIDQLCNIIIVDDMSDENIKKISKNHSYLRVENDKGFNFSMLNNIAALICMKKGNKKIILWNNDLYIHTKSMFKELIKRHDDNLSSISGSKLLYPPLELSFIKEKDSKNIQEYYQHVSGKWRNTVQYGGTIFLPIAPDVQTLTPYHYKRFAQHTDPRVDCDKGVSCITGALMIIQMKDFVELGGLNPSLSKNFQDIDFCLRAVSEEKKCYYFGKDIYFYHDESVSLSGKKIGDSQLRSDEILFGKIWNKKIGKIVI